MFIIKLAEIRIRIENQYSFIANQCRDYICSGDNYDFSVSVSEDEIREEQKNGDFYRRFLFIQGRIFPFRILFRRRLPYAPRKMRATWCP